MEHTNQSASSSHEAAGTPKRDLAKRPRRVTHTPAPAHAYRVTSGHDRRARPLKPKQEAVLASLAHHCPHPGNEISAREIAADTGFRLGSLMLSLRFLATLNLVREHPPSDEAGEPTFSPTLFGLARMRDRRGV